jgi:hypothetical protein
MSQGTGAGDGGLVVEKISGSGPTGSSTGALRGTLETAGVAAAVVAGVIFRLAQYLSHQSIWGDEAYLILNVRAFGWTRLISGPLNAAAMPQACPPLMLAGLKLLDFGGDGNEWVWRLPALVASCLALVVTGVVARRVVPRGWAWFAPAALAVSGPLIFQAATCKQYSGDVLAAAVLLLAFVMVRGRRGGALALSALGAGLVWMSLAVPMVYGPLAVAMLIEGVRSESGRRWGRIATRWIIAQGPMVGSAVALGLLVRGQYDPTMQALWMKSYPDWHHAAGAPLWLGRRLWEHLANPLLPIGGVVLVPMVVAAVGLWRGRSIGMMVALVGPLAVVVVTAMGHLFPLTGQRVSLFLLPGELVLAAMGFAYIDAWVRAKWSGVGVTLLAAVLVLAASIRMACAHVVRPQSKGDLRLMIETVGRGRTAGEAVYAGDAGADAVMRVYARRTGVESGGIIGNAAVGGRSCWVVVARDPSRRAALGPTVAPGWPTELSVDRKRSLIRADGWALHLVQQ